MTLQLTARNAGPADLVTILNSQQARKLDIVAPAAAISLNGGLVVVNGSVPQITETGVNSTAGTYRPTDVFDDGLSAKLRIPRDYLRRMRDGRPDLIDANVNGWLHGSPATIPDGPGGSPVFVPGSGSDDRSFLLRLFRSDEGGEGVARAMLSDSYALSMDNLDVLTAVMRGVQDTGLRTVCRTSDLSERRMRVRIECPDIHVQAPVLAAGYTSPFERGATRAGMGSLEELRARYGNHHLFDDMTAPIAFIGFDLVNSETGGGAFWLTPVVVMLKCTNGLKVTREGTRKVHHGAKLAEGIVRPSLETLRLAGQLITSETTDTVKAWLNQDYLGQLVAGLEERAAAPIASPSVTVPAVCEGLGFTEAERTAVLDLFITSGQPTAGGVMQAVSAYAQTVEDADRAYDIEAKAVEAMEAATR